MSVDDCCNQCGNYLNCHYFTYNNNRCQFYPTNANKRPLSPGSGAVSGQCVKRTPRSSWQCNGRKVCVAAADGTDLDAAADLAAQADVAIVVISQFAKEVTK